MRYFREESPGVYEQVRTLLNEAWNLPNDMGTQTCIPPASTALKDAQGRIVLPLKDFFCEWDPASSMLPQLLGSGAVSEITEAEYLQATVRSLP
jgi:hypothetical protein